MRVIPIIATALAVAAFSGCFGHPDDSLHTGSQAVIEYQVADADGDALAPPTRTPQFVLGSGGSGLGEEFERSLLGIPANGSFERTVEPQPGGTVHRVDSILESEPADRVFPVDAISQGTGIPAEDIQVGFIIPDTGLGSGLEVVAREGDNATLRFVIRDDQDGRQVETAEFLGLHVHYWVEDGRLMTQMRPIEGAIVVLPVRDAEGRPINPFGLPPGMYRMEGLEGDELLMVGGSPAQVATEPITVSGRVVAVGPSAQPPQPTDGHFGSRVSPVRQD